MSTVSMFRRVGPLRAGLAGAGALLLAGLVTAGMAVADPGDTEDVDLGVVVLGAPPPGGALAFSVASASATLTEAGSTALIRQFTGTLPTVTVTDTRDNVPADVFWHVVGSATDFIGNAAQPNIPA
ncbi:MAG: hypothetical protein LBK95_00905, partial [Bifidobacteriaceae bacterium]|nr:hypothetical protein [Bifidobacteriaceae bacterium]